MTPRPLLSPLRFALAILLASASGRAAPETPFHFAHRGGAHEFEENTMFAFESSYEKGVRGYSSSVRVGNIPG